MKKCGINFRRLPTQGKICFRLGSIELNKQNKFPFEYYIELRSEIISPVQNENLDVFHIPLIGFKGFGPSKMITSEQIVEEYKKILIKNQENIKEIIGLINKINAPFAFGCAAGKDRTGVLSYIILRYLGEPINVIASDFSLSKSSLIDDISLFQSHWLKKGLTKQEYIERINTSEEIIFLLDKWVSETYGSVYEYLA